MLNVNKLFFGEKFFISLLLTSLFVQCLPYIIDPGPKVLPTRGALWPKAQREDKSTDFFTIVPRHFRFTVVENDCGILEEGLQRYWNILNLIPETNDKRTVTTIHKKKNVDDVNNPRNDTKWIGDLSTLEVIVKKPCTDDEFPNVNSMEEYVLDVNLTVAQLTSTTVWGALRGLESFTQSIYYHQNTLLMNVTRIVDFPRYRHRGLLLDTSRHYLPLPTILTVLKAMSYNKMNVFHWHIVDDQSFPYVSKKFPELSEKGAYHPELMVYTQYDVKKVIEFARVRGIRVLVEFDTPGHTRSWGEGVNEILTNCYGPYKGKLGPIDPSRPFVYTFLENFFEEIVEVFPDKYVHLGGDEVGFECWESNPDVNHFMDRLNITKDYKALESYYVQKLVDIVHNMSINTIVWQEVFENEVKIPKSTIVHVWKDGYEKVMDEATKAGHTTLLSSCWYLDHLTTGGDWTKFYDCEPSSFNGTEEQKELVLGGEACMWGEVVDKNNVISRIWPRASVTAEKLWSPLTKIDEETYLPDKDITRRLEEHACRMNKRGIRAQPPNGPGFCL